MVFYSRLHSREIIAIQFASRKMVFVIVASYRD